jgi:hypothetical protein
LGGVKALDLQGIKAWSGNKWTPTKKTHRMTGCHPVRKEVATDQILSKGI